MCDSSNESKLVEIENEYKYYQRNAEKHPFYSKTWKIFYEKRYFELKCEGKANPDKYDYVTEWIDYWTKYIKDYYESKLSFYKKQINDRELSPVSLSSSESFNRSQTTDESGRSVDKEPRKKNNRNLSKFSSISSGSLSSLNDNLEAQSKESTTILSVCRLLSVLDCELGVLLSNKIIDLIAKSIELEKIQANSSDEILMTNENATFLGTVKEKLKGLISTDLLENKKIPVAKKCVQNIAQLIHQHSKMRIISDEHEITNAGTKLTEVIRKALLAHGKIDVLPEELDVITEIYLEELEKTISAKSSTICFENLRDEDLKILIKSFTQLKDEEQQGLIAFISEIEGKEPERVKQLQDFFNNVNTFQNTKNQRQETIIDLDDDDEDYNIDELVRKIK